MAGRSRARPKLAVVDAAKAVPQRLNRVNLLEVAYERIEDLIINCELKPGRFLSIQDLQEHHRFAAGRRSIRPSAASPTIRSSSFARGTACRLRRSILRASVCSCTCDATSSASSSASRPSGRVRRTATSFFTSSALLRDRRDKMTIGEFNVLDRRIDKLILTAAGERFLEHTLRPLHTIFRRIGWIHHNHTAGEASVHHDDRLPSRRPQRHRQSSRRQGRLPPSDKLIEFVDSMFDIMEREIDPSLLDSSLEPIAIPDGLGGRRCASSFTVITPARSATVSPIGSVSTRRSSRCPTCSRPTAQRFAYALADVIVGTKFDAVCRPEWPEALPRAGRRIRQRRSRCPAALDDRLQLLRSRTGDR